MNITLKHIFSRIDFRRLSGVRTVLGIEFASNKDHVVRLRWRGNPLDPLSGGGITMVYRLSFGSLPIFILLGCVPANMGQTKVDYPPSRLYSPTMSIVRLLANPEKFDGSRVTISGYLHLRFEDAALYLSKNDADYLCSSNALWVEILDSARTFPIRITGQKDTVRTHKYFDFKHVTLSGTFRSANHGHMGAFPGAIESVDVLIEDRQWYDGPKELWKESGHGLLPVDRAH